MSEGDRDKSFKVKTFVMSRCDLICLLALRFTHLRVSAHDLAGLLVQSLTVPLWINSLQLTSQAVVLTHKQCVYGSQSDVLVHTHITLTTDSRGVCLLCRFIFYFLIISFIIVPLMLLA